MTYSQDWASRTVVGLWVLFVLVWLVSSAFTKRTKRLESVGSRLIQGVLGFAGGLLCLAARLPLGPLDDRLWSRTSLTGALAVALVALGFGFAFWARAALGRNWSGRVTLKEGHELVQKGPYALVRNPIYTGLLVALAGLVVLLGRPRGLLGFAFFVALFLFKIRVEESFLKSEFGPAFLDYQKRVKSLIPFIA